LKDQNEILDIIIYPNPFNTKIHINNADDIKEISLYNSLWHLINYIENHNKEKIIELNAENLPHGLYFIKLEGSNNQKYILKIIKN